MKKLLQPGAARGGSLDLGAVERRAGVGRCILAGLTLMFLQLAPSAVEAQSVTVTVPNTAVNWAIGSSREIRWSHTLGAGSAVTLEKLILATDGSIAAVETIAASVPNATSTAGRYVWTVTGPDSNRVRIQVRAATGTVMDASNVNFTIAPAFLQVSSPGTGVVWGQGTTQTVAWTTNLTAADRVDVRLSTDGGSTFAISLGTAAATARKLTVTVPAITTSQARIRLVWTNAPTGHSAQGLNPGNFRIEELYITVLSPNGGERLEAGLLTTVRWATNYSNTTRVRIELSTDGGSSYPVVVAADVQNKGSFLFVVEPAWISTSVRMRVTSRSAVSASDESDRNVVIYRGLLLTNGRLNVVVRPGNGSIRALTFSGYDFYNAGTPVSDFGFQNDTDTATYRRNRTNGTGTTYEQPVSITATLQQITVAGTYTGGGASVAFSRRYELVPDLDILRITTTFTNHGEAMFMSCFDTFDPDQGTGRGYGRNTYNDVYLLGAAVVGRSIDRGGMTTLVGSQDPFVTVGAGYPFWLDKGSTLNTFFDAPYDGNGALADQGLHIGARFFLPAGGSYTFTYDHAVGPSVAAAEDQFVRAPR